MRGKITYDKLKKLLPGTSLFVLGAVFYLCIKSYGNEGNLIPMLSLMMKEEI